MTHRDIMKFVHLLLPLALSVLPGRAVAQPRDPAAAQALFDEALALMKASRHAEACPKLTESQRLDPGVGTQFHLADCLESIGRTASAWALFLEVESVSKASSQPDRERVAAARATRLEPRLPRLRIRVPPGRDVPGLEIFRDGVAVGSAQWGTAIPIDPGPHEVVSSAPGRRSTSLGVEAREGETVTFEVPELAILAIAGARDPVPAPENAPVPSTPEQPSGKPMAVILGLGGVGILGVGVSAAFGLMARSENQSSKTSCRPDNPNLCNATGVAEREGALEKGNVATVALAVGGAALAGAAVLWLATGEPERGEQSSVRAGVGLSPGGASFVLGAGF